MIIIGKAGSLLAGLEPALDRFYRTLVSPAPFEAFNNVFGAAIERLYYEGPDPGIMGVPIFDREGTFYEKDMRVLVDPISRLIGADHVRVRELTGLAMDLDGEHLPPYGSTLESAVDYLGQEARNEGVFPFIRIRLAKKDYRMKKPLYHLVGDSRDEHGMRQAHTLGLLLSPVVPGNL